VGDVPLSVPTITKAGWPGGVVPNVVDYDAARATFTWAGARAQLDGLPGGQGLVHLMRDGRGEFTHGHAPVHVCHLRQPRA
jgi:hypothetical protein